MSARLSLLGITRSFPGTTVLDGCDLELQIGEVVSVRGASGTGKSTLLNIAGLLDTPNAGSIAIDGTVVPSKASAGLRAGLRAKHIGFVFQGFHLLPEFNVLENVLLPVRANGGNEADRQRADALLDRVGLNQRRKAAVQTLSGGEAQRVALCRALVRKPPLILADEPTGNLDPHTADEVLQLLLELAREDGSSVLLVTHDPRIAASADRRSELRDGRLHDLD
ncbi:MAG: ABC transporter ATP-binding protein [Planctomycetota bacterium]|jgi:lipoprotein-releasing system ATP-binding protein|nr:ABC transporter ATP-binding protein [Planctomycetota bacterium]